MSDWQLMLHIAQTLDRIEERLENPKPLPRTPQWVTCGHCHGTALEPEHRHMDHGVLKGNWCHSCDGKGRVLE